MVRSSSPAPGGPRRVACAPGLAFLFLLGTVASVLMSPARPAFAVAEDAYCKYVPNPDASQAATNPKVPFSEGATKTSKDVQGGKGVLKIDWIYTFPKESCAWEELEGGGLTEWNLTGANVKVAPPSNKGNPSFGSSDVLPACSDVENNIRACNVNKLGDGLEFFALAASLAGIFISAALWALGSKGQNPGQELTGKRGLVVCLTAAFLIGAYPSLASYFTKAAGSADNTGVTTATLPSVGSDNG